MSAKCLCVVTFRTKQKWNKETNGNAVKNLLIRKESKRYELCGIFLPFFIGLTPFDRNALLLNQQLYHIFEWVFIWLCFSPLWHIIHFTLYISHRTQTNDTFLLADGFFKFFFSEKGSFGSFFNLNDVFFLYMIDWIMINELSNTHFGGKDVKLLLNLYR